jgi:hypothetical protein
LVAQFSAPVVVPSLEVTRDIRRLVRVRPKALQGSKAPYVEDFLQRLVHAEPAILPVEELEASFSGLRSVCRELPLGHGETKYLDNLLINADGRICLVECKLWRNPEAIREVVAQILDYAGELAAMSYQELQAAVRKALRTTTGDPLLENVLGTDHEESAGIAFIDAVTRSLETGNFLLLVVGDGIRTGLQQIAGLLQNRATLGFSFSLIEMAIYGTNDGDGPYYVQPRRLLRTEKIIRNVFELQSVATTTRLSKSSAEPRPQTISEQDFYEELRCIGLSLPERLRAFLDKCQSVGCRPELRRKYVLYVDDPTGGQFNLGTIAKDGLVYIQGAAARDAKFNAPIGQSYIDRVAGFLPGAQVIHDPNNAVNTHIRLNGRMGVPLQLMLDNQANWLHEIERVVEDLRRLDNSEE